MKKTAVEVEIVGGGKIIYYRARAAGIRGRNNMTTLNKDVIVQ